MVASTLNAFAASFAPSDQPAHLPSSGMNAFATSFSPEPKPQRPMNPFAMSFAPKDEQQKAELMEKQTKLNAFAMSFAPADQITEEVDMEAPAGRLGGGHGGPTAPRDFAVGPAIPVVFVPASGLVAQQVWSAPQNTAPPSWLEQAAQKMGKAGWKNSVDGSASPVSTRLDDDGSNSCPSSGASDCDNSPVSLEDVCSTSSTVVNPAADDPAHKKGWEILSMLRDFQGDTQQPCGPRRLVEELGNHNDKLIAKLQRQKAELCRSRLAAPGKLAFADRAECDRAIQSGKTVQAPTEKSWGKLTQAVELNNAQLLADLADLHCRSMLDRQRRRSQQRYWGNNNC